MNDAAIAEENGFAFRLFRLALVHLCRIKQTLMERGGRAKARRLVLLEALELGNRRQLFLVVCDEHRFLVGAGGDRVGTVVAIPGQAAVTATGNSSPAQGTQRMGGGNSPEWKPEPAWLRRPRIEAAGTHGLRLIERGSEVSRQAGTAKGSEAGRTQ